MRWVAFIALWLGGDAVSAFVLVPIFGDSFPLGLLIGVSWWLVAFIVVNP